MMIVPRQPSLSLILSTLAAILVHLNVPHVSAADSTTTTTADDRTALQKHVDFFDRNSDGYITISETKEGLDAIGFPRGTSWLAANAIHVGLPKTHGGGSWWQLNVIDTSIINKGIHGSDSGAYGSDGSYLEDKLQAMFENYDANDDQALDTEEFKAFHEGQYSDWSGSLASKAEWSALMMVAGEMNEDTGLKQLTRETIAGMFDGELFYQLEERESARRMQEKSLRGRYVQ